MKINRNFEFYLKDKIIATFIATFTFITFYFVTDLNFIHKYPNAKYGTIIVLLISWLCYTYISLTKTKRTTQQSRKVSFNDCCNYLKNIIYKTIKNKYHFKPLKQITLTLTILLFFVIIMCSITTIGIIFVYFRIPFNYLFFDKIMQIIFSFTIATAITFNYLYTRKPKMNNNEL